MKYLKWVNLQRHTADCGSLGLREKLGHGEQNDMKGYSISLCDDENVFKFPMIIVSYSTYTLQVGRLYDMLLISQ